jgi:pimeloyl-ACP methyl ester carboxylesterase
VVTSPSNTVVLIHGLWMTPLAWEHWVERYEARGFTVLTPGYPGIGQGEAGLQALRENPDAVAGVGVREIMDYLTDYITKLDSAPIIMGHSFGGTFAQLLVGNGLGSAGISIDGARKPSPRCWRSSAAPTRCAPASGSTPRSRGSRRTAPSRPRCGTPASPPRTPGPGTMRCR